MPTLLTVRQFTEKHNAFSEKSMRARIFFAETNGFSSAFRRIGRRVYVVESEFFSCVERMNASKNGGNHGR